MRLALVILFPAAAFIANAAPLHIDFHMEAAGKPLIPDSLRYENSASETFSITRLDWLATDFSLTTESGETLVIPDSNALVTTRGGTISLPELPGKKITAITFHIGPDKEANHSDPASYPPAHVLNPNVNKLHWDWQGGYIFLAIGRPCRGSPVRNSQWDSPTTSPAIPTAPPSRSP